MLTRATKAGAALLVWAAFAAAGQCQTRPTTSGKVSFYEPEPNPHAEGWYRPNVPGSPSVDRGSRRGHAGLERTR